MLLKCSVISGQFLYRSVCISMRSLSTFALLCTVAIGKWSIFLALKRTFELFSMSLWDQVCVHFGIR